MGASRRRVEERESVEGVGIPAERDQSRPTPVEKDVGESERERDIIEMKMTRYRGRSKEGERQHGLLLLPPWSRPSLQTQAHPLPQLLHQSYDRYATRRNITYPFLVSLPDEPSG